LWDVARDEEIKIQWQEANEEPSNGRSVSRKILLMKTRWNWIGHSNQKVPSHPIQTNARYEKQLRGEATEVAQEQYKSDGFSSGQSSQRVEDTTDSVCCRDVRIHHQPESR
jgi:hypothetical protein